MKDLDAREIALLAPLLVLTIYYGVQPGPILDACAASVDLLVKNYEAALARHQDRRRRAALRVQANDPLPIPSPTRCPK